ncbi:MAG: class I SAM-dependent methyltransferase [Treponemataceae bacterium]|nr:class I SAM-dependent methyltransferase [Treponemataceae bacterium]
MNFSKKCRICGFEGPVEDKNVLSFKNKRYFLCSSCQSISLEEECFLKPDLQKERYLLHNNSLEDDGYKNYLEKFLTRSLEAFQEYGTAELEDAIYLDYGSGPNPCLCELVRSKSLFKECLSYDLFFAPDLPCQKVDYMTCLEVAEHFENPLQSFRQLSSLLKEGGILSLQTHLLSENIDFEKWWYREDTTHVCFYTEKGLIECAKKAGLVFLKKTGNTCLFRKGLS